jgi:hypothetical protein
MSPITAIVEAAADGTLHLPLPAELRHGKVKVVASVEPLSVAPEPAEPGSGKGFGALTGKLSMAPLFHFRTTDLIDYPELLAFLATPAVVGGLVSRAQVGGGAETSDSEVVATASLPRGSSKAQPRQQLRVEGLHG